MKEKIQALVRYVTIGIWEQSLDGMPKLKSRALRFARVLLLAYREFVLNQCQLRASALTFYSLLSIVPVLAVAFGIAQGFGLEKTLEVELRDQFVGHEQVYDQVSKFALTLLNSTAGGLLAGLGMATLLWTVIQLLNNIEREMNVIWHATKERPFFAKFSTYLTIVLIAPIMVVLAGSATVFVATEIEQVSGDLGMTSVMGPAVAMFLKFIPFIVISGVFSLIFILMPNTKVNIVSALIGGLLTGFAYQGIQWGYINFQVGVSRYNAIYGSFAALPLFLIWVQLSWLLILFGASVGHAHQYVDRYEYERLNKNLSLSAYRKLSVVMVREIAKRFEQGLPPLKAADIAVELRLPSILAQRMLEELVSANILVEVVANDTTAYMPSIDIHKLTVRYIIDALEQKGENQLPLKASESWETINKTMDGWNAEMARSSANKKVTEI